MTTKDLYSNIKATQLKVNAVQTPNGTAITGDALDMQGYESLAVLFDVGNSGDTLSGSLYWTLTLTECDTSGGSYTAVASGDYLGGVVSHVIDAPTEDSNVFMLGYKGSKRYVKAVATATGNHSTGTPLGMIAVQSHAHVLPVQ
jgi:hypothetical protein